MEKDLGQWAVGSGQWAVGSPQWAVGSRQWAVRSRQWAVRSGQSAVSSGQSAVGSLPSLKLQRQRAEAQGYGRRWKLRQSGCAVPNSFNLLGQNVTFALLRATPPSTARSKRVFASNPVSVSEPRAF